MSVRKARTALLQKGFRPDDRDHKDLVHHNARGERTGPYVCFSRGAHGGDTLGPNLLRIMARELWLCSVHEVTELFECTMAAEQYAALVEQRRPTPRE
ncbi:MAG: hypothetical protein AB1505_22300 [Candidatus Latescibacterota bacterium]